MKKIIKILKNFNTEIRLKFKKDGIYIKEMDAANVSMLDIFIPNTLYNYKYEKDIDVGVNTNMLYKELNNSIPFINIIDDFLLINNVKIPIIDIDISELKRPEVIFKSHVTLYLADLNKFKSEILKFDESVKFICSEITFSIENTNRKILIHKNSCLFKSILSDGDICRYSSDYVSLFLNSLSLSYDKVKLHFSSDSPLMFEIKTIDGIKIDFILAPRIMGE